MPISTIYMTCQVKHNQAHHKNVNDDDRIEVVEVKRSLARGLKCSRQWSRSLGRVLEVLEAVTCTHNIYSTSVAGQRQLVRIAPTHPT